MGTKILNDIQNDLKLLITSLTGFEESDEGFQLCEKYVLSNMKHHRFLSINSHSVKRTIDEIHQKFTIYGKYNVAREFKSLVDTFLTSFPFDQHPQYDLQWTLLSLLLNLSRDTTKSEVDCLHTTRLDKTCPLNTSASSEVDEIDWGEHLKEGQDNFFLNYASSSESEWSDDGEDEEKPQKTLKTAENLVSSTKNRVSSSSPEKNEILPSKKDTNRFKLAIESRNWLDNHVENTWWNGIGRHEAKITSSFSHSHLCRIYNREVLNSPKNVGTIGEYQACREMLWMLQVPGEMVVYGKRREHEFRVRESVSICSLTAGAFASTFSGYCRYFGMMDKIDCFERKMLQSYAEEGGEGGSLPLTVEAYNSGIREYYRHVRRGIIEIERRVMMQNDVNTFLTLSREIKGYLRRIEVLDEIHGAIVKDAGGDLGEGGGNWRKSYKLLLAIYREMENSRSRERANICASLYLASLRVYLNIIDTWLSEGRLEDFRREFLICKEGGRDGDDGGGCWSVKFVGDKETEMPDPIMKKLVRKVRDMGRSIELLVTLDRKSDMWRINSKNCEKRIPLNEELTERVIAELSKYGEGDVPDCADDASSIKSEHQFNELEENIRQQVLRINNPFLMKVFQPYLPPISVDVVDNRGEDEHKTCKWGIKVFEELEKISQHVLPFRKVLEDVLEEILNKRYSCAAELVKDILVNEYKLEHHLRLMRSIYMMERGHVMKIFYQQMFKDIENNVSVTNPESLTTLLEEVLSDEWRDSNSHNRWSISLKDACTRQVLQAVDHVALHYSIDWPMNMVLTEDILKKYNDIFKFQLKLKWALWALNNLRFADLEGRHSVNMRDMLHHFHTRRLESLRFWLLHAIGSIHSYLCGQVLQSLGLILEQELSRADSLDAIIEAHNDYLEKVHEHCLQTPQFADIMVTINNLLGMCAHVRDRWERGAKQLIAAELDLMECSFTKYHTYLALALHNAVQHKEADYYLSQKNPIMRELLTEVAHQSLPPSGISIPIEPFVNKINDYWSGESSKNELSNASLSEYDKTFFYIWYESMKNFFSLSRYNLTEELMNLKDKFFS